MAYVNLLSEKPSAAAALAVFGAVTTTAFVMLEIITNTKIQRAKAVIRAVLESGGLQRADQRASVIDLFGGGDSWSDEGFRSLLFHDPVWIGVAEATIVSGFSASAAYALSVEDWALVAVVVGSFVGILALSLFVWWGASRREVGIQNAYR